ncbi:MAG TPA: hypothetical protein PLV45_18685, partial [bacterium]|nr:hypothetical protein [bacterium]
MQQARHIAHTLLTRTGTLEPPVIPKLMAESLNISVLSRTLPRASRGYSSGRRIVVNRQDLPEYQNFTIARELGILLRPLDTHSPFAEDWPDEFADELLLPSDWFSEQGHRCRWDLGHLKWLFETASWDAIARKTLWFHKCVITIHRNHTIVFRKGLGTISDTLLPVESQVLKWVLSNGSRCCRDGAVQCRG